MRYVDMYLSHVGQFVLFGYLGHLNVAVIEVAGILPNGRLIPTTSVGNNKTWVDQADHIILEINSWQSMALEGMHDIYYGTRRPPHRQPMNFMMIMIPKICVHLLLKLVTLCVQKSYP